MKSKLLILILAILFAPAGYVFAQEGMKHDESTKATTASKSEEVGNKICPVSGDKIPAPGEKGEMGEAVKYEYNGKIYNLCCKMCIKDFKKNPEKYSKIAEEEAVQEKAMGTEDHNGHDHSDHKH